LSVFLIKKTLNKIDFLNFNNKNNFKMKHIKLSVITIISTVIFSSCDNDFESKHEIKSQNSIAEKLELVDGTIRIENITTLRRIFNSYKENNEGQNNFNKEIRYVQNRGFKPLTPIFDKNDTEKFENFLINKKQKIQNKDLEFGITSKLLSNDEEIDFDDELISDPALAALLNEDREIYVADSLYKYTETGLYFCHTKDKKKLYDYLSNTSPLDKLQTARKSSSVNSMASKMNGRFANELIEVSDGIMHFVPNPIDDWVGGGMYVPLPNIPNLNPPLTQQSPRLIKQNLPICRIDDDGWFEKIFGESEVATESYGDGKRIKVKFWNQNYFLFSSIGCSVRFQKRVKFLGISGWQKSYAEQIELGINSIEFDYKFNVPAFNNSIHVSGPTIYYNYKGVNYNQFGQVIPSLPTRNPGFPFNTDRNQNFIDIYLFQNDIVLSSKEANKKIDDGLKALSKLLPRDNPDKKELDKGLDSETIKYNILKAVPFSNKVTLATMGVKWTNNDDNAITQYFDFNFLFRWKSEYKDAGDYLKGLNGGTSYSKVGVDIYGAALHKGQWKGRRLILEN
jgi:hypothetical protein